MAVLSVETKKISELEAASSCASNDTFVLDTALSGTQKLSYSNLIGSVKSTLNVPAGADTLLANTTISTTYENEAAKVAASSLTYDLNFRLAVTERERNCIYGVLPYGIEWTLTNLLAKIRAEKFDDFAIGDYIVENSNKWLVAAKNYWTAAELGTFVPHVVLMRAEPTSTNYKYNDTATNTGGFNSSALATTLTTTIYNALPSALRAACLDVNSYESTKSGISKYSRKIKLPSVRQVTGESLNTNSSCYMQLPICRSQVFLTNGFWLLDADTENNTNFLYYSQQYKTFRTIAANSTSVPVCPILAIG